MTLGLNKREAALKKELKLVAKKEEKLFTAAQKKQPGLLEERAGKEGSG